MAATVEMQLSEPVGPYKRVYYKVTSDATTATWKTGHYRVVQAVASPKQDEAIGVVINSNDGTEDSVAGDLYLTGVTNPGIYYVQALVQ